MKPDAGVIASKLAFVESTTNILGGDLESMFYCFKHAVGRGREITLGGT